MFQAALTNNTLSPHKIVFKYNNVLNSFGNKIVGNFKYSLDREINYLKMIKVKNLLNLTISLDNLCYLKEHFGTINQNNIINNLNEVLLS